MNNVYGHDMKKNNNNKFFKIYENETKPIH